MKIITEYNACWNVPNNVNYFISTNETGFSRGLYKYANFSDNVGDKSTYVKQNIHALMNQLHLSKLVFMNQTHSSIIKEIKYYKPLKTCDATYTTKNNIACAVLTADCIPILVTNNSGDFIGCIHAGWRGLYKGILEKFFKHKHVNNVNDYKVLLGPSISTSSYEVDLDIYNKFSIHRKSFKIKSNGKYLMNIRQIAKDILNKIGVYDVTISEPCTHNDTRFYSFRKHNKTGRFISLIWLENDH